MQQLAEGQCEHFVDIVATLADLATEVRILRGHSTPMDRLILLSQTVIVHLASSARRGTLVLVLLVGHDTLAAHVGLKLAQCLAGFLLTLRFSAQLRDLGTFDGGWHLERGKVLRMLLVRRQQRLRLPVLVLVAWWRYDSISQLIHLFNGGDCIRQMEHAVVVFEALGELELILSQDGATIFIRFLLFLLFIGHSGSRCGIEWRQTNMHRRRKQVIGRLKVAISVLENGLQSLFLIASILGIGANDTHLVLHGAREERLAEERVSLIKSRDISLRLARHRKRRLLHKVRFVRFRWLCAPATSQCMVVWDELVACGVTLLVDEADQRRVVILRL